MDDLNEVSLIESRIDKLRQRLEKTIDENSIDSETALKISMELDTLIVGYYKVKKDLS